MKSSDTFNEFVRQTHIELRSFVAATGVSRSGVDDLVQEAYVAYFSNRGRKPADVEEIAWVKGIARNKCLKYFRSQKRAPFAVPLVDVPGEAPGALNSPFFSEEAFHALASCMDKLTPRARRLIYGKYEERARGRDLAEREGLSVEAVRTALTRARETLRICMTRKREEWQE